MPARISQSSSPASATPIHVSMVGVRACKAFTHLVLTTFSLMLVLGGVSLVEAQEKGSRSRKRGSNLRSAEEKIILRLDLEGSFVPVARSGDIEDPATGIADDVGRDATNFVFGEARIGTRGALYKPLNTYLFGTGGLNLGGAPFVETSEALRGEDAALHGHYIDAYGSNAFFVRLAYGELEGLTEEGPLSRVLLRGGRQFHWAGPMGVTFDGATLQYSDGALLVGLRLGQRANVFDRFQNDAGLVGGASFRLDLSKISLGKRRRRRRSSDMPSILLKGEYNFIKRNLRLTPRDELAFVGFDREFIAHFGEIGAYWDITRDVVSSVRVQSTDDEISHVRADLRWGGEFGAFSVSLDQKIGEEVLFGLAGNRTFEVKDLRTGFERRTLLEAFRLAIPDRAAYTRIDADLVWAPPGINWLEIQPSVGAYIVHGEAEELSAWDANSFNWGLAAYIRSKLSRTTGVELDVQYRGRVYVRDDIVGTSGLYTDVAAGPEAGSHEVFVGLWYNVGRKGARFIGNRLLQERYLSLGISGFAQLYQLETVHESEIDDEVLLGAETEIRWTVGKNLRLNGRYQFAVDSNVFLPEISSFHEIVAEAQILF